MSEDSVKGAILLSTELAASLEDEDEAAATAMTTAPQSRQGNHR